MFPPPLSFLFLFVALNFVFNLSICRMSLRTLLNMMIWLSCCWKPENARKTWKKQSFVLKWSENIVIIDISQVFLTVPVKERQENVLTQNSADLWLLRCSNWHVCSLFEHHQFVSTNRFVWELQAYLNSCCLPQNTTEVFFFMILFPVLVKASLGIFFLNCLLCLCIWLSLESGVCEQPHNQMKMWNSSALSNWTCRAILWWKQLGRTGDKKRNAGSLHICWISNLSPLKPLRILV